MKKKQGEQEAKEILEAKGFVFNSSYCDDNSKESMPDLRFENGRYLEVTHTLHNNGIVRSANRFHKKSIEEQLQIMTDAKKAYDRIKKNDYPQFKKDAKIVRSHFGIDVSEFNKHSEFNCDIPIIESSTDNIIREIREKTQKYSKGDTDLFIFILDDEYNCLCDLLKTRNWNSCYDSFMNAVMTSPFKVVYLCVWDFEAQTYNIENPILLRFETVSDNKLSFSQL